MLKSLKRSASLPYLTFSIHYVRKKVFAGGASQAESPQIRGNPMNLIWVIPAEGSEYVRFERGPVPGYFSFNRHAEWIGRPGGILT